MHTHIRQYVVCAMVLGQEAAVRKDDEVNGKVWTLYIGLGNARHLMFRMPAEEICM